MQANLMCSALPKSHNAKRIGGLVFMALVAPLAQAYGVGVHEHGLVEGMTHSFLGLVIAAAIGLGLGLGLACVAKIKHRSRPPAAGVRSSQRDFWPWR